MQRYVQIERIENLERIGIIAGTLSVHRYRDIINHMVSLAESHDQSVYTFMVGKMNVPKLGNFPGIEGFILVGCERSCFINTRVGDFFQECMMVRTILSLLLSLMNMRFPFKNAVGRIFTLMIIR